MSTRRGLPALRLSLGFLAGTLLAIVEILVIPVAGIALLAGRTRGSAQDPGETSPAVEPAPLRLSDRLVAHERRRLERLLLLDPIGTPDGRRGMGYLIAHAPLGFLGGAIIVLVIAGAYIAVDIIVAAATHGMTTTFDNDPGRVTFGTVGWLSIPGVVLLFLAWQGLVGVRRLEARLWAGFVSTERTELRRRVASLTSSRADVVQAVDDERRRIERDLHDGIQQRLVSVGLLIGRSRRTRDAEAAGELVARAHAETQAALAELREVAWRIYPSALDGRGLASALESVAGHSVVPVDVDVDLREDERGPIAHAVETALYFVASEAVTNAVKHSGATRIGIEVRRDAEVVRIRVRDDGRGGADPAGVGLGGLARRVGALDGRLAVTSPVDGPTTIEAVIPCG